MSQTIRFTSYYLPGFTHFELRVQAEGVQHVRQAFTSTTCMPVQRYYSCAACCDSGMLKTRATIEEVRTPFFLKSVPHFWVLSRPHLSQKLRFGVGIKPRHRIKNPMCSLRTLVNESHGKKWRFPHDFGSRNRRHSEKQNSQNVLFMPPHIYIACV